MTSESEGGLRRLAISAKDNQQVSASSLPSDFVTRVWEQWRDPHGPFNRAADGLALVTRGTIPAFQATWVEVKNACSGSDAELMMSRIRSNGRQSRVFDSVMKPGGGATATEGETIELIRRLHVLPVDLQFEPSETVNQAGRSKPLPLTYFAGSTIAPQITFAGRPRWQGWCWQSRVVLDFPHGFPRCWIRDILKTNAEKNPEWQYRRMRLGSAETARPQACGICRLIKKQSDSGHPEDRNTIVAQFSPLSIRISRH